MSLSSLGTEHFSTLQLLIRMHYLQQPAVVVQWPPILELSGMSKSRITEFLRSSTMVHHGQSSEMSRRPMVRLAMGLPMMPMLSKMLSLVSVFVINEFSLLICVAGIDGITRSQNKLGTTGQPAVVYLPSGVYILSKPIQLYVGTVLMGDPLSPPTLKAASGFNGNTLIYGKDPNQGSTINFYIGVKNLVFDSNNIDKDTSFTIIDWSVSQATQLTNCVFNMPSFSSGHTGIAMPEGGSGTYLGDLQINGGVVGIDMSNQQYMIKGVTFQYSTTAIKLSHCFDCIIQDCTFLDHNIAIDMTSNSVGSLVVLDSSAQDVGTMVATVNTGNGASSLILENIQNNGAGAANTVVASGNSILSGNVADTWVMGNTVSDYTCSLKSRLTSTVHTRWISLWKLCRRCNFHHPTFF